MGVQSYPCPRDWKQPWMAGAMQESITIAAQLTIYFCDHKCFNFAE